MPNVEKKKEWIRVSVYVSPKEKALLEEVQKYQQRKALSECCRVILLDVARKVVAERRLIETQLEGGGIPAGMGDFLRSVAAEAFEIESKGKDKGKP